MLSAAVILGKRGQGTNKIETKPPRPNPKFSAWAMAAEVEIEPYGKNQTAFAPPSKVEGPMSLVNGWPRTF